MLKSWLWTVGDAGSPHPLAFLKRDRASQIVSWAYPVLFKARSKEETISTPQVMSAGLFELPGSLPQLPKAKARRNVSVVLRLKLNRKAGTM
jgi:hypothetical protein